MRTSRRIVGAVALALVAALAVVVYRPAAQETLAPAESTPAPAPAAPATPAVPAQGGKPSFATGQGERFAPQRVLVGPRPGVSASELAQLNERVGGRVAEVLPGGRVREVRLPASLPVAEAVRRYEDSALVRFAEPDFLVRPSATEPDDPDYPRLWGLNNTGQTGGSDDADIDAPQAWGVSTGTDAGSPVAVIDTGVDVTHPDLQANIWRNPGEIPGNGVDDDDNGYVDDIHGWDFANDDNTVFDGAEDDHGTHVAGTIAAVGDNGVGVAGVAWRAEVMSVKFLGPDGGYTSDAIAALDYAVANGARISNNSWGGGGASVALQEAITRAADAGHLVVAAAGNGGSDGVGDNNDLTPSYPASYPQENIVAVAASTETDRLAGFSNYGSTSVDLAAPGTRILSTLTNGAYGAYSGTSMATPFVTGAAVLVLAANSSLSAAEIRTRLLESVDPVSALGATVTGGRLDVARAVGTVATTTTADLSLTSGPSTVTVGGTTALSGVLTSGDQPLAGETVVLESRAVDTGDWTVLDGGTRTTDAEGRFVLDGLQPTGHTDYRARYTGGERVEAATSSPRRVNVRAEVTLRAGTRDLPRGRSRVLSGLVRPAHEGSVRMIISRNGSVIARPDLALVDSRYRLGYRPKRTGRYSVAVRRFADTDHLAAKSLVRSFRVVR